MAQRRQYLATRQELLWFGQQAPRPTASNFYALGAHRVAAGHRGRYEAGEESQRA